MPVSGTDNETTVLWDACAVCAVVVFLLLLVKYLLASLKTTGHTATFDQFFRKHGYSWDYVLVFRVRDEDEQISEYQSRHSLKHVLLRTTKVGMENDLSFSSDRRFIFCKLRVPMHILFAHAAHIQFRLQLDPTELRRRCATGRKDSGGSVIWRPISLSDEHGISEYWPYDHIYGRTVESEASLYKVHKATSSVFRGIDRIKLIRSLIDAKVQDGGCGLDIAKLVDKGALEAAFPLHEYQELLNLQRRWLNLFQWPWDMPIEEVKNYFGEKIGLYFRFLEHFTTWLIIPSIFGFITFIDTVIEGTDDSILVPYFAFALSIWSTLFLEFWKRKESRTAMEWGMDDFEDDAEDRPQFVGERIKSPVNGHEMLYFPAEEYQKLVVRSAGIVTACITGVIAVVAALFVMQIVLADGGLVIYGIQVWSLIPAFANAILIQVLNKAYSSVAVNLTDAENHRTDPAYEDSLIVKTFLFQFVNSYASLFFVAFLKEFVDTNGCMPSCVSEAHTTLGTIFLTRLTLGNLQEVGIPTWKKNRADRQRLAERRELEQLGEDVVPSPVEEQFHLDVYHELYGTFEDYLEIVILFGYGSLFAAAFPLAPLLTCVNNFAEGFVDGYNLSALTRRVEPHGAEDIGSWQAIMETMSVIAVVTNCGIVTITSSMFLHRSFLERAFLFILLEHIIMLAKYAVAESVEDEPGDVAMQKQRRAFLVGKILDNVKDDVDDDESMSSQDRDLMTTMNLIINRKDEDWEPFVPLGATADKDDDNDKDAGSPDDDLSDDGGDSLVGEAKDAESGDGEEKKGAGEGKPKQKKQKRSQARAGKSTGRERVPIERHHSALRMNQDPVVMTARSFHPGLQHIVHSKRNDENEADSKSGKRKKKKKKKKSKKQGEKGVSTNAPLLPSEAESHVTGTRSAVSTAPNAYTPPNAPSQPPAPNTPPALSGRKVTSSRRSRQDSGDGKHAGPAEVQMAPRGRGNTQDETAERRRSHTRGTDMDHHDDDDYDDDFDDGFEDDDGEEEEEEEEVGSQLSHGQRSHMREHGGGGGGGGASGRTKGKGQGQARKARRKPARAPVATGDNKEGEDADDIRGSLDSNTSAASSIIDAVSAAVSAVFTPEEAAIRESREFLGGVPGISSSSSRDRPREIVDLASVRGRAPPSSVHTASSLTGRQAGRGGGRVPPSSVATSDLPSTLPGGRGGGPSTVHEEDDDDATSQASGWTE